MIHFLTEVLRGALLVAVFMTLFAISFKIRNEALKAFCSLMIVFTMGWFHLIGIIVGLIGVTMIRAAISGTRKDRQARKAHRAPTATRSTEPLEGVVFTGDIRQPTLRPNPNYPHKSRRETR